MRSAFCAKAAGAGDPRPLFSLDTMSLRILIATLLASCMACAAAQAAPPPGAAVAARCQACHGLDGVSRMPEAPNLAGQVDSYLAKALQDFKAGRRSNEMMNMIAQGLSEQQIQDVAAYYAALPACPKP